MVVNNISHKTQGRKSFDMKTKKVVKKEYTLFNNIKVYL